MVVLMAPFLAVGMWAVIGVVGSVFTSASLLLFSLNAKKSGKSRGGRNLKPETQISSEEGNEEDVGGSSVDETEQETVPEVVEDSFPENEFGEDMWEDALECEDGGECASFGDVDGYLLPARDENDRRPLTVVLDLDETLVRSCEEGDVAVHLDFAASVGLLERLEIHCGDPETGAEEKIISFVRPGLVDFLENVSKFAEIVVFTAGDPEYAGPLCQMLDPEGKYFDYCLFREATVATAYHDHVKDMARLGRDLTRTVLVDNNPYSFLFQPDNGILCESFYGDASDRHLLEVTLPLLRLLACLPDVRPILRRRYNLDGWRSAAVQWHNYASYDVQGQEGY